MVFFSIKKSPLITIAIIVLIGVLYVFLVLQPLQGSTWFASLNPVEQYLLYNIGIVLIFSGLIGSLITRAQKKSLSLWNMLLNGFAGFIIFSFVIDMYEPPFALAPDGSFIISGTGGTLEGTSVDYMVAWVYNTYLGISGPLLYYMVYAVTPVLAILVFALIIGPKRFIRLYGGQV